MKTEGGPSPAEKGSPNGHKPNLKEKAAHQLREFLVITIYLWALFALLVINQSIVLAREAPDYQAHGFAIFNALMLAKILLTGEDLKFGTRFKDKPLVYSILYKCFIFTLFLIGFHIVERVIDGVLHGRSVAQSFPDIGGGSVQGILSLGATVFVALIPFFAFREIARVIGHSELWSLLLSRGTRVHTLQSRPQQWWDGVVGVLASGAWIARHPPRHRLDSAVRKFKRNPYWSLIAEILEELPKLTEEEKRQLWIVLNHEVAHELEEETPELLA